MSLRYNYTLSTFWKSSLLTPSEGRTRLDDGQCWVLAHEKQCGAAYRPYIRDGGLYRHNTPAAVTSLSQWYLDEKDQDVSVAEEWVRCVVHFIVTSRPWRTGVTGVRDAFRKARENHGVD